MKREEKKTLLTGGRFAENVIKVIVFFLVGGAVLAGNFFLENRLADGEGFVSDVFTVFDYESENVIPSNGVIRFADEDEYGFANLSVVQSSNEENEYVFNIVSGKIWGDFTISNSKVNIVAGSVVVIPGGASFDLEFDGEKIGLSVFDGDVYVGFLGEGIVVEEYLDQYSSVFMNKILVPRDTQVSIPLKKIAPKLESLLYLKLVKEFKYSAIPSSEKTSTWVEENQKKDSQYHESIEQNLISEIIFKGSSAVDSLMNDFVFWAEENLTFVPEKKYEIVFSHLFEFLDDAIFYANEGDEIASNSSWDDFNGYLASLPVSVSGSDDFFNRYDSYIDVFEVFSPTDIQYFILEKLLEKKLLSGRDVYEVLGVFWLDVYEALNSGSVAGEEALNKYYGYLDNFVIGDRSDLEFHKDYITYQNQLFDNLFLRYSVFYRDGYFAMKNVLEQELLAVFEDDEELSQELISNKIDFLKRLKKFFLDGEIEVTEAKQILSRLVEEVDELMPLDDLDVAVIELFETRLDDIGDFWGYLNSPEYHVSKTYGTTHEERYESYLEEKDKIWDFINIQEDVLGETVAEVTVADVVAEIEAVFFANPDVSEVEVGEILAVDERYINVQGVVGGYPFDAVFDRDKDLLNDVYTYNELVSDRPVKIDNLLALLQERFADLAEVDFGEEEEFTIESVAERAARLFIAELIAGYGFVVEMDDVSVVDELNAIYRVEEIYKDENEDVVMTFDFVMNGEKAINLFLVVKGDPFVLDGEYTLDELASVASAEEDFLVEDVEEEGGVLR